MAFKFPWTVTKSVLAWCKIPPHTITLPPPKRSCSWSTLAGSIRSPSRLQTRNLPSANFKLKRDLSVKTTWFHCCPVQRWCALVQFSLIRLWSGVKGTPTFGQRLYNRAARSLFLTVLAHIPVPVAFLTNPAIQVLLRQVHIRLFYVVCQDVVCLWWCLFDGTLTWVWIWHSHSHGNAEQPL